MHNKPAADKTLIGGMILSMALWGLSWPSGKVLTNYCTIINFTVYRYILVITTMLLILPMMGVSFRVRKQGIPVFATAGILLAVYSYFLFNGLKNGSAGAGGVLVTTLNPIVAYGIGMALKRKLPELYEAAGLALGLVAGCVLLKVWDHSTSILQSGNLNFLLAAVTWAVMSKFTSKGAAYGSSFGFSLWQYVVTLLCLLPFANYTEMAAAIHITEIKFWGNLIFGSSVVTALATSIYFFTTTRLGPERASSFIFMVPLGASVSSWLLLGEKIQLHTAIGGLLGIAAVFLINRKKPVMADKRS